MESDGSPTNNTNTESIIVEESNLRSESPSIKSDFLQLEDAQSKKTASSIVMTPEISEQRELIVQPEEITEPLKVEAPPGGFRCLVVLFGITLLSYIDRYLPSAMKDEIKADLNLSDAETSYPFTAFLIVYMCVSPVFAHLSDLGFDRRKLILSGVICWSIATASNYFARSFWEYMVCRAFVAIGEAALVTIAPTLICDFYPPERRNSVFARYAMATPIGAGIGYILGGGLASTVGWRSAFLVCGVPGLLIACTLLATKDPPRGTFEPASIHATTPNYMETLKFLIRSRRYITMTAGYILGVFAVGGLSDWMPAFLERQYGTDPATGGLIVGGITIITTPVGVLGGSYLSDRTRSIIRESNFAISAIGAGMAMALAFPSFLSDTIYGCALLLAFSETFCWFNSAPWSTETAISVPPLMRARAFGVAVFLSHALGDAISPSIIGLISDSSGLRNAMLLIPGVMGLAFLVWGIASRTLPEEKPQIVELATVDSPPNTANGHVE